MGIYGNNAVVHYDWMNESCVQILLLNQIHFKYSIYTTLTHFGIVIYLLPFMCMFKHVRKYKGGKGWASIESICGYGPLLTILVTLYDFYVFIWAILVTWHTINAFTKEFILFSLVSLFYLLSVLEF